MTALHELQAIGMKQRPTVARSVKWLRGATLGTLLAVASLSAGCSKSGPQTGGEPRAFASPAAAAQALHDAAKAGDSGEVLALIGSSAQELLLSGDTARDRSAFATFTAEYDRMHRFSKLEGGALALIVGLENYPFPFPLRKDDLGNWYFDADRGGHEFLGRRIGDNELTVTQVLNALADAQAEYFSVPRNGSDVRQYAQKFSSNAGKNDGLYWKAAAGEHESPLGPLLARAAGGEGFAANSQAPAPFHGYFFRIMTEQGPHAAGGARDYLVNGQMTDGFAFIAYPAEYGKTGVMSFVINQDGEIFQKDFGAQTTEIAQTMSSFDPDPSWSAVRIPTEGLAEP